MRSRKILGFISLGLMLVSPAALFGQNSKPVPSLSLRQMTDQEMFNLQKNTERVNSTSEKLSLLAKAALHIHQLRSGSPKQFADDEAYLNRLEGALARIPKAGPFVASNCDQYRSAILRDFDPKAASQAAEESKDPAIAKAIFSLDQVCGKK